MSFARSLLWPAVVTSLSTTYFLTVGIQEKVLQRDQAAAEARRAEEAALTARLGTDIATLKKEAPSLEAPPESKEAPGALDRRLGKTLAAQSRVLMGLSESQERWNQRVEEMEKRRTDSEAEDLRLKAEIQSLSEKVRTVEAALRARQEAEKLAAKKMGKMVANMPPGKAADLLQELDDISAVGLLTQMKEPDVARVLALLPPKRAAGLTERMAEFRVKTP
ncbi:MAG TPA: hypothetical protein PKZ00_00275 [Elusimicrobiota bacterium]|nr:hypothetical protein [Elusimicrobiota bacterium]HMZ26348.1 hypothetical protein [Elusimicrobiota bacterium]HNA59699.1 hypothetical protein [Elusimicrobiota bacterium]HNF58810.1 hypothetical protein [Elusimicrobiota bacterium]HNI55997.1 hypothetical protein [Elusimicrobiota bacterium]